MAVPWHCPACNTVLRRSELESRPLPGERYRCHICRLTLDFDADLNKLVVAPFETDHQTAPPLPRSRVLPSPITPSDKSKTRPRPRRK